MILLQNFKRSPKSQISFQLDIKKIILVFEIKKFNEIRTKKLELGFEPHQSSYKKICMFTGVISLITLIRMKKKLEKISALLYKLQLKYKLFQAQLEKKVALG